MVGETENFSAPQRPKNRQKRRQRAERASPRIGRVTAPQPTRHAGERLTPKGSRRLRTVQPDRPATHGRGIRHPIGVLQRRRRFFPRAVLHEVSPECLTPSQQAVVGVRQREQGKQGEGLSTALAKAASDPNPVVMFIVRLLATATVTDDGIAFANRASPQQGVVDVPVPIGFDLVWRGRKCDKKNRSSWGPPPGVDPPRSQPEAGPLLLKTKSQLEKNNASQLQLLQV